MNEKMIEMLGGPWDGQAMPLEWLGGSLDSVYIPTNGAVHRYSARGEGRAVYDHAGYVTTQQIDDMIEVGNHETHDTA